jgi:rhodanese-related sulfurtransferase
MLPKDGVVVVYCVHGKWVSQKAANYLQDQGFEVYALDGGIEHWKSTGHMRLSSGETDGDSP